MTLKNNLRNGLIFIGLASLLYGGIQGCSTLPKRTFLIFGKSKMEEVRLEKNEFVIPDEIFNLSLDISSKYEPNEANRNAAMTPESICASYIREMGSEEKKELYFRLMNLKDKYDAETLDKFFDILSTPGNIKYREKFILFYPENLIKQILQHERGHKIYFEDLNEKEKGIIYNAWNAFRKYARTNDVFLEGKDKETMNFTEIQTKRALEQRVEFFPSPLLWEECSPQLMNWFKTNQPEAFKLYERMKKQTKVNYN